MGTTETSGKIAAIGKGFPASRNPALHLEAEWVWDGLEGWGTGLRPTRQSGLQRCGQIGAEICGGFQPDGKPDETVGDPAGPPG